MRLSKLVLLIVVSIIVLGSIVYAEENYSNLALNENVTATANNSYLSPYNAIDGDNSTQWNAGTFGTGFQIQCLKIDLGDNCNINNIVVRCANSGVPEWFNNFIIYNLYISKDNSTWQKVKSFSWLYDNPNRNSHTININNSEARYIRFDVVGGTHWAHLCEMEIWGNLVEKDTEIPYIKGTTTNSPNSNGWYNSNVTVHFEASDSGSGIKSVTPDVVLSEEGINQSVVGTAIDNAGNSSTAIVSGINIDKTEPEINLNIENGAVFALNQNILLDITASDNLSGVDFINSSIENGQAIDTGSVGEKEISIAVSDKAGMVAKKVIKYYVKYEFSGVLSPISSDKVYKIGSTLPIKFYLKDYEGTYISDCIAKLSYEKINDDTEGNLIEAVSTSNSTTGNLFRYDESSNQYVYNLSTKSGFEAGTYKLIIILDDGYSYEVEIGLK